jgi:hypothetical protein
MGWLGKFGISYWSRSVRGSGKWEWGRRRRMSEWMERGLFGFLYIFCSCLYK